MDQSTDDHSKHSGPDPRESIPFWKVVLSVIQASFGVQNQANRERDFSKGHFVPFVIAAVLFTILFVLTIAFVVSMVLPG